MHLGIREAQHATAELMRLGLILLAVESHAGTRQLDDEETVHAFAGVSEWTDSAAAPLIHLELATAGEKWYDLQDATR